MLSATPKLGDSRQRVATAGDRKRRRLGDGMSQRRGAGGELRKLEYSERSVPDDGSRRRDDRLDSGDGFCTDVHDHVVVHDFIGAPGHGRGGGIESATAEDIDRHRNGRIGRDHTRRDRSHVGLAQGLADVVAGRVQKRIGDAATDDQLVDHCGQRFQHRQLG